MFQCPHGLELLRGATITWTNSNVFQCPHGLELLRDIPPNAIGVSIVSMPSRA